MIGRRGQCKKLLRKTVSKINAVLNIFKFSKKKLNAFRCKMREQTIQLTTQTLKYSGSLMKAMWTKSNHLSLRSGVLRTSGRNKTFEFPRNRQGFPSKIAKGTIHAAPQAL